MDVREVFDAVTGFIALAAAIGILLLLPLYLSQRRDVRRMRAWMEADPDHPAADIAASELLLDRAETELATLVADEPKAGETPAAARVTHERPALERITMERAALAPHPRWRRLVAAVSRPRVLVVIALVAVLLGAGGIYVAEEVLKEDTPASNQRPRGGLANRSEITVAVLNGTAVNGLAGKVSSDVVASGYRSGAVASTTPGFRESVVLFADGRRRAGERVARDLGIGPVRKLDQPTAQLAGNADVVVIAGEDRAVR